MRIGVVGGGPAGLYFALLMKRQNPAHSIKIVEQNPADATFGFGVVFSDRALGFLKEADPESYVDTGRRLRPGRRGRRRKFGSPRGLRATVPAITGGAAQQIRLVRYGAAFRLLDAHVPREPRWRVRSAPLPL